MTTRMLPLLLAAGLGSTAVQACSDFLLNREASGLNVVSGRTMDFEADLTSALEVIPRGTVFQELPATGCPDCADFRWEAKLGFVSANTYGMNMATDGMNEAGLSAAWLYLSGTEFPSPLNVEEGVGEFDKTKPVVTSLCSYVLGNFGSVDEVRVGLEQIQVAGIDGRVAAALLNLPMNVTSEKAESVPLHLSVHDAQGNNLVVEFLQGEMKLHANPNGVLTNEPPLEEHLEEFKQHETKATGDVDSGDLLPGGYGSSERFLRLSVLNRNLAKGYSGPSDHASYVDATGEQRAVSDALHLLNTVVRPPMGMATQWSIVRDHKRRMLYIRSTTNQLLRRVSLDMLDFGDRHARRLMAVSYGAWFLDSTLVVMDDDNHARTKDAPPRSKVEEMITEKEKASGQMDATAALRKIKESKNVEQELPTTMFEEKRQAREVNGVGEWSGEDLPVVWVFAVGCVVGGMVMMAVTVGWKVLDRSRRQRGYQLISGA